MAKNKEKGKGRKGMVMSRAQFDAVTNRLWHKRDTDTGRIMDVKTTGGKFKGVRTEKKKAK